ncbi:DUF3179 domain-containing (seleno)protein [Sediminitomix flava]|uniref:Uncharacterized protein DUF3179 n=1 Tax=Sediminitomix flava TaxID=379075 RepID=A0A315Z904_SEDFL|nr:DUF3179 domain-containing (seleno)protein [Sediminitomix flava]PWJ41870.1 uncharacterized protein DUF3179 [Sediminitomix flava]
MYKLLFFILLLSPLASWAQKDKVRATSYWETNKNKTKVNLSEYSAFVKRDAFKPINYPSFYFRRLAVEYNPYELHDAVVVVSYGGQTKAYPYSALLYHQVINDRLGGIPILVSYCPISDALTVFQRNTNGDRYERELDFKVSGMLRRGNTVLYDKQTETWWQQYTGKALTGDLIGTELKQIPSEVMSLKDFFKLYDWGMLMTEHELDPLLAYGQTPYYKYDDLYKVKPLLYDGPIDGRLMAMQRVLCIKIFDGHFLLPQEEVRKQGVLNLEPKDKFITIFYKEGVKSMLDEQVIAEGAEVGSFNVFSSFHDGQHLTFVKAEKGHFMDQETQSIWNFRGQCVKGDLHGQQLKKMEFKSSFAFAPLAFYPNCEVEHLNW